MHDFRYSLSTNYRQFSCRCDRCNRWMRVQSDTEYQRRKMVDKHRDRELRVADSYDEIVLLTGPHRGDVIRIDEDPEGRPIEHEGCWYGSSRMEEVAGRVLVGYVFLKGERT